MGFLFAQNDCNKTAGDEKSHISNCHVFSKLSVKKEILISAAHP